MSPVTPGHCRIPARRAQSAVCATVSSGGLIQRKDFGTVPTKVEYRLTPAGKSFVPVIAAIRKSGERHLATA
jgi:DNA-binding HxlR family transcriptional regulator